MLFPAAGPSHCAAPAYSLRKAGRRQESRYLCGNLVFGPPDLTRRPCVFYARRTYLLTILHHTHSASWARLAVVRCETQTRPMRRTGERCRSEWRLLAPVIVGERPRASQEPPPDPLSPLRRPSWCEAAKRPTGADRGRISVAGRISAVSDAYQRPPRTFARTGCAYPAGSLPCHPSPRVDRPQEIFAAARRRGSELCTTY